MNQHLFPHGFYMTVTIWIDDPIFLDEPMTRNYTLVWNPDGFLAEGNVFQAVDELADKPLGWVPSWPLGMHQTEFGELHNIPFKATQGGRDTLYPEYMLKIEEFRKEEAAARPIRR